MGFHTTIPVRHLLSSALAFALFQALPCSHAQQFAALHAPTNLAIEPAAASGNPALPTVELKGTVVDPQGMPVAGAQIHLLQQGVEVTSSVTNEEGHFAIHSYAGQYRLLATAPGMAARESEVDLNRTATSELKISLALAQANSSVEVVASAYRVEEQTSATKVPMRLLDIPQTVTTITQEMLRDRAVDSMQDALAYTPGVSQILGEGRRDQVSIRGMSSNNDMYVDGIKDDAGYYRDLSSTERIEVVEGPAAVLYGRGTSGGLVNRITKKPRLEGRLAELGYSLAGYGSQRGEGDIDTLALRPNLGLRSTGAWETGGSYRHFYQMDRYAFAPSLRWKPTPNQDLLFQFDRLRDERRPDRGIPSLNGKPAPVGVGTYYGYGESGGTVKADYIHSGVAMFTGDWKGKFGAWNLHDIYRQTGYETAFQGTLPTGVSNGKVTRYEYDGSALQRNRLNQFEGWRRFEWLGTKHLIVAGVEYGHQSVTSKRFTGTAAAVDLYNPAQVAPVLGTSPAQNDRFTGQVWAGYVQDEISFGKHWKTLLGLRMDDYRQSDWQLLKPANSIARRDTQPSPRIGLLYQPSENNTYYASWSHTFDPSGEGLSLTAAATNNSALLDPEKTDNYELGSKHQLLNGRLNATTALYRLNRTDIKVPDYTADPTGATYVNGGQLRTDGFESSLAGQFTRHWKMSGGWSWMDSYYVKNPTKSSGVVLTGHRAIMIPVNSGSLWQMYEVKPGFGIGLGAIAMNSRYASTTNLVKVPGYVRLDATAYYRTHRWDLNLHVENLANTHYYVSAQADQQIMPGSPVFVRAGVKFRY